jgi:hypothetical protein
MYSAEVLSQLRTLNWLLEETRRLPPASTERAQIDAQLSAVRARLPLSILHYHDNRAAQNLPSIANLRDARCGHCQATLPPATVAEVSKPGNFAVCPACGIFLWSGEAADPNTPAPKSRDSTDDVRRKKSGGPGSSRAADATHASTRAKRSPR